MIQLQRCKSLNYLDVSYTKFNNFNIIIENCYNLKSLCLSGLDIPSSSFESLSQLPSLEFLALTNSSIATVDPCKDMLMLRSLHLGQTNVSIYQYIYNI
jgi:Leucine-rich repeat (LRR) protein